MGAVARKLCYDLQEVSELAGVAPPVIRYWEAEFGLGSPAGPEGRLYTPREVDQLLAIKRLLQGEGLSVAAAKRRLRQEQTAPKSGPAREEKREALRQARELVNDLLDLLDGKTDLGT